MGRRQGYHRRKCDYTKKKKNTLKPKPTEKDGTQG